MQKLAIQCLLGFTDFQIQIRYKSEQNITRNKKKKLYLLG